MNMKVKLYLQLDQVTLNTEHQHIHTVTKLKQ